MSERVKLIWDFRGPNAREIAAHHVVHLKEFANTEKLDNPLCGSQEISTMHHMAYMVVNHDMVDDLRKRLKPNRGQRYLN
jgi:hypothetical protein